MTLQATPRVVAVDDVASEPWANGGGRTRVLAQWPGADGPWRVRLSVAEVERDGPFSSLPGVTRWFAVLRGEGVALQLEEGERMLRRGDGPVYFDGAQAPQCRLLGGATRDLNLMLRGLHGRLQTVRPGEDWQAPPAALCGVFAVEGGRWQAGDESRDLPAMSLLWFEHAPQAPQRFEGEGVWIVAQRP